MMAQEEQIKEKKEQIAKLQQKIEEVEKNNK